MESPPRPPAALRAPWLLGLLLWPWTLRLAGRVFLLLTCSLAPRRAAVVRPPARAANSSLGGICWLRLNVADFAGEALGTRRCLANASPRWLSKGREQRSPLTAVSAASLPARPDLPALKQEGVGGRHGCRLGAWGGWQRSTERDSSSPRNAVEAPLRTCRVAEPRSASARERRGGQRLATRSLVT